MDIISQLPDELLLRILSSLPTAKDVVATMVLSKRWQFLWMFVPKLVYDDSHKNINYARFSRFVDRYLVMHEAPGIKTLDFKLGKTCGPEDIKVWIKAADKRCVRELIISGHSIASPAILPRSWYTGCKMVVRLELNNAVLVDFNSSSVSFPSLKNLSLKDVVYPNDEFVNRFLSGCHVLEYLNVEQRPDDNVTVFTVRVPSLKNLLLSKSGERDREDEDGFVIDAPSLECIDIFDYTEGFCVIKNNMPNVAKAGFGLSYLHPVNILGYITSVERLCLCLTSKGVYPVGTVFHHLVYLEICTCEIEWLNLLLCMLRDSPNLRALKLKQYHELWDEDPRPCWSEPSSVPECLLSSLETFQRVKYEGREEEKEVAAFILRNGKCLNKATISSKSTQSDKKKLELLKDLAFSFRRSPTCQLIFD